MEESLLLPVSSGNLGNRLLHLLYNTWWHRFDALSHVDAAGEVLEELRLQAKWCSFELVPYNILQGLGPRSRGSHYHLTMSTPLWARTEPACQTSWPPNLSRWKPIRWRSCKSWTPRLGALSEAHETVARAWSGTLLFERDVYCKGALNYRAGEQDSWLSREAKM